MSCLQPSPPALPSPPTPSPPPPRTVDFGAVADDQALVSEPWEPAFWWWWILPILLALLLPLLRAALCSPCIVRGFVAGPRTA